MFTLPFDGDSEMHQDCPHLNVASRSMLVFMGKREAEPLFMGKREAEPRN